jgi:thiamine-phosphate pyrophosphorylase
MTDNLKAHLRLMLVTDDRLLAGRDVVSLAEAAVRGGVTAVQLRLKHAGARRLAAEARRLRRALPVPIIVNDRPDVAFVAECWVHLGALDLPVPLARRILPAGAVIGASVGTPDEAAEAAEADYWGIGPIHGAGAKADAGPPIGVEGFRQLVALAAGRPCLAIGGVRPADVRPVLAAGGIGVAVASGILGRTDVEQAAREYAAELLAGLAPPSARGPGAAESPPGVPRGSG